MLQQFSGFVNAVQASSDSRRNAVLRNTYWLLSLSMIPTVLGVLLGMQFQTSVFHTSGIMGFIIFTLIATAFIYAIEKNKYSSSGIYILLGFTFFMGIMLSNLIRHTLHFSNGPTLLMLSFGGTSLIFATMASIAATSKRDFSDMSKWLTGGSIVLIVAVLLNIFLHLPALYLAISVVAIALFSAYLLYDIRRIIDGGESNYICATLSIYLSVYNIFANLLSLAGFFGGED
jgi:modulator of FtsH protease